MTRPDRYSATCAWAIRLCNSTYVANIDAKATTYDINSAHLWIDTDGSSARRWAASMPWVGPDAVAVRARP